MLCRRPASQLPDRCVNWRFPRAPFMWCGAWIRLNLLSLAGQRVLVRPRLRQAPRGNPWNLGRSKGRASLGGSLSGEIEASPRAQLAADEIAESRILPKKRLKIGSRPVPALCLASASDQPKVAGEADTAAQLEGQESPLLRFLKRLQQAGDTLARVLL